MNANSIERGFDGIVSDREIYCCPASPCFCSTGLQLFSYHGQPCVLEPRTLAACCSRPWFNSIAEPVKLKLCHCVEDRWGGQEG